MACKCCFSPALDLDLRRRAEGASLMSALDALRLYRVELWPVVAFAAVVGIARWPLLHSAGMMQHGMMVRSCHPRRRLQNKGRRRARSRRRRHWSRTRYHIMLREDGRLAMALLSHQHGRRVRIHVRAVNRSSRGGHLIDAVVAAGLTAGCAVHVNADVQWPVVAMAAVPDGVTRHGCWKRSFNSRKW